MTNHHTHYTQTQIIDLFKTHKSWEDKYRQILQLAKQLPPMDSQWQIEENRVTGCESDVWLHHHWDEQQQGFIFSATSNARIVKGLLVIILAVYQGANQADINSFDIDGYFAQLDLLKHLSPSRANGINGIVQTIKKLGCGVD